MPQSESKILWVFSDFKNLFCHCYFENTLYFKRVPNFWRPVCKSLKVKSIVVADLWAKIYSQLTLVLKLHRSGHAIVAQWTSEINYEEAFLFLSSYGFFGDSDCDSTYQNWWNISGKRRGYKTLMALQKGFLFVVLSVMILHDYTVYDLLNID